MKPNATVAGAANIEISSSEVALGNVVLTFSIEQAQPTYDRPV